MRSSVAATHAAFGRDFFYTLRGGKQVRFHPPAMPEADSMPPADMIFDNASTFKLPKQGKLAAVINHHGWLEHHDAMRVRDFKTTSEHLPGMSSVANRETTRFMSYS